MKAKVFHDIEINRSVSPFFSLKKKWNTTKEDGKTREKQVGIVVVSELEYIPENRPRVENDDMKFFILKKRKETKIDFNANPG